MHTLSKPLAGLRNQKPTPQGTHPRPPLGTPRLILAATPLPPPVVLGLAPPEVPAPRRKLSPVQKGGRNRVNAWGGDMPVGMWEGVLPSGADGSGGYDMREPGNIAAEGARNPEALHTDPGRVRGTQFDAGTPLGVPEAVEEGAG